MTVTNWSSNLIGSSLSGGGTKSLTASGTGQAVTNVYHNTGKYYFEFQSIGATGAGTIGLCGQDNDFSSNTHWGVGLVSTGATYNGYANGANGGTSTMGSAYTGQTVSVAVDLDNRSLWFRYGAGNWNNSGTANPATNTGGIPIAGCPALSPMVMMQSGGSITIATDSGSFLESVPSGFSSWDTAESFSNAQWLGVRGGKSGTGSSATFSSQAMYSAESGDLVVAVIYSNSLSGSTTEVDISSVTDTGSLTWTRYNKFSAVEGGTANTIDIWYALPTSTKLGKTVSATFASSVDGSSCQVLTFKNFNTSHPFEQSGPYTASNGATSAAVSINATTLGAAAMFAVYGSPVGNFVGNVGAAGTGTEIAGFVNNSGGTTYWQYLWLAHQQPDPTTVESTHAISFGSSEPNWVLMTFGVAAPSNTGSTGVTGTWTSTEATDSSAIIGVGGPISGTWSSTEAQDTFATSSGFTRFEVVEQSVTVGSSSFNFSSYYPDTIIVLVVDGMSTGGIGGWTVSGPTGDIVWQRQDRLVVGTANTFESAAKEIWWAYAHRVLDNETITVSYSGAGGATSVNIVAFAVKGMNGNYNQPWDSENKYAFGSAVGNWQNSSATSDIASFIPYATGPVGSPSGFYTDFATDIGSVTLASGGLHVASSGSWSGSGNVAFGNIQDELTQGAAYFEMKATDLGTTASQYGFGLVLSGLASDTTNLALDDYGWILRKDGTIWGNGAQKGALDVAISLNDVIACVVDASGGQFWFRNLTSGNHFWNGSAKADPSLRLGGLSMVPAGFVTTGTVTRSGSFSSGGDTSAGMGFVPIALVDQSSSAWEANFGQNTFTGTLPEGISGWPGGMPSGATHTVWPHITILATASIRPSGWDTVDGFSGFTSQKVVDSTGSQRSMASAVMTQFANESVLVSDNVLFANGNPAHLWTAMYDTLVPGAIDPGSWESTEAADTMTGHGYPGSNGVVGDLDSTEAPDTFAAIGYVAAVGAWTSTEAKDIFSAYGFMPVSGPWASTEAQDVFAGTGVGLGENGTWTSTEAVDILTMTGYTPDSGPWESTEQPDQARFVGAGVTVTATTVQFFVT
jgi:hypothetical protein